MIDCKVILHTPNNVNIYYAVQQMPSSGPMQVLSPLIRELRTDGIKSKRTTLHLVFATVAFSMGLDSPNVCRIVHWSPPDNLDMYIQETGRAGRDGEDAIVLFIINPNKFKQREKKTNSCSILFRQRKKAK